MEPKITKHMFYLKCWSNLFLRENSGCLFALKGLLGVCQPICGWNPTLASCVVVSRDSASTGLCLHLLFLRSKAYWGFASRFAVEIQRWHTVVVSPLGPIHRQLWAWYSKCTGRQCTGQAGGWLVSSWAAGNSEWAGDLPRVAAPNPHTTRDLKSF